MEKFRPIQPLPTIEALMRCITSLSENLQRIFADIATRPHLDSQLIEREGTAVLTGLSLTAGQENLVEHGLGKAVRGWWLADIRGPAFVWRVADSDADLIDYLPLACSHDVTVTLVVF